MFTATESHIAINTLPWNVGSWGDTHQDDFDRYRSAPEGVLIEQDEVIIFANASYAKALGYESGDDLIGAAVSSVIASSDRLRMLDYGRRRARGEAAPTRYQFDGLCLDGSVRTLIAEISTDTDGQEFRIITRIYPVASSPAAQDAMADFTALYDTTAGSAYALLRRMLGNDRDAEDVLQESYLQAWRDRESFNPERSSRAAWLFVIARSRAVDRIRKNARHAERVAPARADYLLATDQGTSNVDRTWTARALNDLPQEQREAIHLAFFEGFTHVEIASRLGLPLGTVKSRILLAMQKLRRRLSH